MSFGFFIVGGLLFTTYMVLTLWGITQANKKQSESNNYLRSDRARYDELDTDGMGNYSRFPKDEMD